MTKNDSITSTCEQNQVSTNLVFVILWSLLFTMAYAQAPLYTSNQNQYFLHGLARAGYGYLQEDWLANTIDPTPVFSEIVYWSYQLFSWPPIFYLYFGILAGIYLYSLLGIADQLFGVGNPKTMRWVFLTALITSHSAALDYIFNRFLGLNWTNLFDGGVAGQRLLGVVLQPSTFGVLLLLSIYLFLRGKTWWSLLPLVLAPTIHPTYLLSAGILTSVYMGITLWKDGDWRKATLIGAIALVGVVPILVHTYTTFSPSELDDAMRARELMVDFRIPHHADPATWWHVTVVVKSALIAMAIFLSRGMRLFSLLLIPSLTAIALTLAQVITKSDTLALLFPWRVSTILVPISTSVLLAKFVHMSRARFAPLTRKGAKRIKYVYLLLVMVLALLGTLKSTFNWYQKENRSSQEMMTYVVENRSAGQVYLVPLNMQDFRLETGVPVLVEFKSIPYYDLELLEWYRRVTLAGKLYRAPMKRMGCSTLAELAAEGVTHVVLPYDHTVKNCSALERQYQDWHYEVFKLSPQK